MLIALSLFLMIEIFGWIVRLRSSVREILRDFLDPTGIEPATLPMPRVRSPN